MYNRILDEYVNGDTLKKIGTSYLTENGFTNLDGFFISDGPQTLSMHLWVHRYYKDEYYVRIADPDLFKNNYILKWGGNEDDFYNFLDKYEIRNINDNTDKAVMIFLDKFLHENSFGSKYDLK